MYGNGALRMRRFRLFVSERKSGTLGTPRDAPPFR